MLIDLSGPRRGCFSRPSESNCSRSEGREGFLDGDNPARARHTSPCEQVDEWLRDVTPFESNSNKERFSVDMQLSVSVRVEVQSRHGTRFRKASREVVVLTSG